MRKIVMLLGSILIVSMSSVMAAQVVCDDATVVTAALADQQQLLWLALCKEDPEFRRLVRTTLFLEQLEKSDTVELLDRKALAGCLTVIKEKLAAYLADNVAMVRSYCGGGFQYSDGTSCPPIGNGYFFNATVLNLLTANNVQMNNLVVNDLTVTDSATVVGPVSANRFIAALGSSAAPSFTFVGATDSGLYAPAAEQLSLVTSGSERLKIDATGSVLPYTQYLLSAYQVSPNIQSVSITPLISTVTFNTIIYDPTSSFSGGTTFTAPVAGYYQINASMVYRCFVAAPTPYIDIVARLVHNGSDDPVFYLASIFATNNAFASSPSASIVINRVLLLAQGDTISFTNTCAPLTLGTAPIIDSCSLSISFISLP